VAQENERQKKAGLPDSATIGVRDRPNINVSDERKAKEMLQETSPTGKTAQERVKRGGERTLGTAYRDEQRSPVGVARRTISDDYR
jgi:hypothetical protein